MSYSYVSIEIEKVVSDAKKILLHLVISETTLEIVERVSLLFIMQQLKTVFQEIV